MAERDTAEAERSRTPRFPGLAGARALVTGGSRGIGRATTAILAASGASVGIAYRSDHEAAEAALREARRAAGEAGGEAGEGAGDGSRLWAEAGDLSDREAVEELFERVDREFGELDVLVGNAGVWNREPRPLRDLPPDEWKRMMQVNLDSIYYTTRAAARRMDAGGRIVLVSSTAGQRGEPEHSHYAATKGAIISFAKSLAGELGPRGITANAVAPGWVDTDMSAAVLHGPRREEILAEIPTGRVATAEDVGASICFLASEWSRQINGEVLNVNGGSVLCG